MRKERRRSGRSPHSGNLFFRRRRRQVPLESELLDLVFVFAVTLVTRVLPRFGRVGISNGVTAATLASTGALAPLPRGQRPWLRKRLRVVDRRLVIEVVGGYEPDAFGDLRVRPDEVAAAVQPHL